MALKKKDKFLENPSVFKVCSLIHLFPQRMVTLKYFSKGIYYVMMCVMSVFSSYLLELNFLRRAVRTEIFHVPWYQP